MKPRQTRLYRNFVNLSDSAPHVGEVYTIFRTAGGRAMIRLFKHYVPYPVLLLGLIDFALLMVAAQAGWAIRLWQMSGAFDADAARLPNMFAFAVTLQTAMVAVGVYGLQAIRSVRFAVARLMVAVMLGIILLSLVFFVAPPGSFWRSSLLYAMWFGLIAMTILRVLARDVLGGERFKRRVMVLGAGARAARIGG